MPGFYRLPFSEGKYEISDGTVTMHTAGSGNFYQHDLMVYTDVVDRYRTGFMDFVRISGMAKSFQSSKVWTPPNMGFFRKHIL